MATAEATAVEDAVALPQPLAVPVVTTVTDALAMAVAAARMWEQTFQGSSTAGDRLSNHWTSSRSVPARQLRHPCSNPPVAEAVA